MNINYKGQSYKRIVSDNLGDGVETITWFLNEISGFVAYDIPLFEHKEILDSEFANELEIYYEQTLINAITPELPII